MFPLRRGNLDPANLRGRTGSEFGSSGREYEIAIPRGYRLRPVEAVQAWLAAAEITEGPLFRPVLITSGATAPHAAARIVERYARRVGLDPAVYAGHSLRSGFLTSAAEAGASVLKLVEVSRHKSIDPLLGYVRRADLFKDHAGAPVL